MSSRQSHITDNGLISVVSGGFRRPYERVGVAEGIQGYAGPSPSGPLEGAEGSDVGG